VHHPATDGIRVHDPVRCGVEFTVQDVVTMTSLTFGVEHYDRRPE